MDGRGLRLAFTALTLSLLVCSVNVLRCWQSHQFGVMGALTKLRHFTWLLSLHGSQIMPQLLSNRGNGRNSRTGCHLGDGLF